MKRYLPILATLIVPFVFAVDGLELAFESMSSSDADILQSTARLQDEGDRWSSKLTASYTDYSLDYLPAPFDFRGRETKLDQSTTAIAFDANKQVTEKLELQIGAGLRKGFSNYRSLWLDTYFDQQFGDLQGVPGSELYENVNPKASSLTLGSRYEYLPASGILQFGISQIQDEVSPGYEIDFDGVRRSSLVLATTVIDLSNESVVTERIRLKTTLRATRTSERDWRYSGELGANFAIASDWILRLRVGGAKENPLFNARFGDFALECALAPKLSLYADARYYKDTGEIENALLFSTASPGLHSKRFGLGLRFAGEKWNTRFYLSTIGSDYDATNTLTDFFQNLYTDRDWTNAQLAFGRSF